MSDIFTLDYVTMTPELGRAIKSFRVKNGITARSITKYFDKASSFISKLEKGDIKKIKGTFLIELCNYIMASCQGFDCFIESLGECFLDCSISTQVSIINIDELLYEHKVPASFCMDISSYMAQHNISVHDLCSSINANKDLNHYTQYNDFPQNQFFILNESTFAMKVLMPETYLLDLCNGNNFHSIHRAIAEIIICNLYQLGEEPDAIAKAAQKTRSYGFRQLRKSHIQLEDNVDDMLNALEPDTAFELKSIIRNLQRATVLTQDYGPKRIKTIYGNMATDLGFAFAYMSLDLVALEKNTTANKQEFLNELKALIEKYSHDTNSIDFYE